MAAGSPGERPLRGGLRAALQTASGLSSQEASARILALERDHGGRREWVWAALDESPLAEALLPLSRLAALVQVPAAGNSFDSLVAWYAADGWRADRAAIDSLAVAEAPAIRTLVASVVRPSTNHGSIHRPSDPGLCQSRGRRPWTSAAEKRGPRPDMSFSLMVCDSTSASCSKKSSRLESCSCSLASRWTCSNGDGNSEAALPVLCSTRWRGTGWRTT